MEIHQKTFVIERDEWTPDIEQMLIPACPDMAEVRAQVASGKALLFTLREGEKRMLALVLRVDAVAAGHHGVIVAAAGNGEGINLTSEVLPVIESMFSDCVAVRIHTARTGLAKRLIKEFGYRLEELVLIKELKK